MNQLFKKSIIIGMVCLLWTGVAFAGKFWIYGKVKGNTGGQVVTIQLVDVNDSNLSVDTSTNRYGYFAISNSDKGTPTNYKLYIYRGDEKIKEVNLTGVRSGKRIPDIVLQ